MRVFYFVDCNSEFLYFTSFTKTVVCMILYSPYLLGIEGTSVSYCKSITASVTTQENNVLVTSYINCSN